MRLVVLSALLKVLFVEGLGEMVCGRGMPQHLAVRAATYSIPSMDLKP